MNQLETKTFVKGTITLAIGGFVVKVLSALYRVPYQNFTGDTGFFIYQQVYPIYYFAVFLGLYGYSASYSKLLADCKNEDQYHVSKTVLYIQTFLGVFLCFIIYQSSSFLAKGLGSNSFEPIIKQLSLLYLFVPILAFIRGYFQGIGNMAVSSASQILEQFFRVLGIMLGLYLFSNGSLSLYGTAKVSYLSAVFAVLATTCFLFLKYRRNGRVLIQSVITKGRFSKAIARRYAKLLFFLLLSSCLTVMLQFIDNFTIITLIQKVKGTNWHELYELKGVFDRAQPFIQVGLVVSTAFSLSVLPYISRSNMKDSIKISTIAFKWSVLMGGAAAIGLAAIMPELNMVLFEDMDGTLLLGLQCLIVLFLSYLVTGLFILQAFYYQRATAIIVISTILLKLVLNLLLIPQIEFLGAVLSSLVSLAFISYCFHKFAKKAFYERYLGLSFMDFTVLMLLLFFITRLLLFMFHQVVPFAFSSRALLLIVILLVVMMVAFLYIILLIRRKIVNQGELIYIPFGSRLYKWFSKES